MESINEFIYSYLHNISVFYCNDLEEMNNMEKLDIDDLNSSIWVLALIAFILTHCCVVEELDEEEEE